MEGLEFNLNDYNAAKAAQTKVQPTRLEESATIAGMRVGGEFNPNKNEAGLSPGNLSRLQQLRATNQSGWDQMANSIVGGLASGALTAVDTTAWIADGLIPNVVKSGRDEAIENALGTEEYTRNAIQQWATDSKAWIDENLPIYQQPGDWNMDDPGFYWAAVKGILDSAVGFAIPGGLASKAVGGVMRLSKAAPLLQRLAGTAAGALGEDAALSKALYSLGSTGGQRVTHSLLSAYLSNYGESKIMGVETYEKSMEYMKPLIDSGKMTEKEARTIAGQQANNFELLNKIFIFTDAYAFGKIFKGEGITRGATIESAKDVLKSSLKQGPTEYLEEVGQNIMQQESIYGAKVRADAATGTDRSETEKVGYNKIERLWNHATSAQAQLEGLMGLISGPLQSFGTDRLVAMTSKDARAKQAELQEATLNFNKEAITKYTDLINKVSNEADKSAKLGRIEEEQLAKDVTWATMKSKAFSTGTADSLEALVRESNLDDSEKASLLTNLKKSESQWLRLAGSPVQTELFTEFEKKESLAKIQSAYNDELTKKKALLMTTLPSKDVTISFRDGSNTAKDGKKTNGGNLLKFPVTLTAKSIDMPAPVISDDPAIQSKFEAKYNAEVDAYLNTPEVLEIRDIENTYREIGRNIAETNNRIKYLNTSKGVKEVLKTKKEFQDKLEREAKEKMESVLAQARAEEVAKSKEEALKKNADIKSTSAEDKAKDKVNKAVEGSELATASQVVNPTTQEEVANKETLNVVDKAQEVPKKTGVINIVEDNMVFTYNYDTDQVLYISPADGSMTIPSSERIKAAAAAIRKVIQGQNNLDTLNNTKPVDPVDIEEINNPTSEVTPTDLLEQAAEQPPVDGTEADEIDAASGQITDNAESLSASIERVAQAIFNGEDLNELDIDDQITAGQFIQEVERRVAELEQEQLTMTSEEKSALTEAEVEASTIANTQYGDRFDSALSSAFNDGTGMDNTKGIPKSDEVPQEFTWQRTKFRTVNFKPKGIFAIVDTNIFADNLFQSATILDDLVQKSGYLEEGSEVELSVDPDVNGTIYLYKQDLQPNAKDALPAYDGPGVYNKESDRTEVKWVDYVQWLRTKLEPVGVDYTTTSAYLSRLPIQIRYNGKKIGYLQSGAALNYNEYNARANGESKTFVNQMYNQHKSNLLRVRGMINAKGTVNVKVSAKTSGLVIAQEEFIRGTNVFDDKVQFALDLDNQLKTGKNKVFKETIDKRMESRFSYATHAIVPTSTKGKFAAFPVRHTRLRTDVVDSIVAAVEIYINKNNLTPAQSQIALELSKIIGEDIKTPKGIRAYMQRFVHGIVLNENKDLATMAANADGMLIGFKGNEIQFRAGLTKRYKISPNMNKEDLIAQILDKFREHLKGTYFNNNVEYINSTTPVPLIQKNDGGAYSIDSTSYKNYNALIRANILTTARGANLSDGTRVYTIQPNIYLDLSNVLKTSPAITPVKREPISNAQITSDQTVRAARATTGGITISSTPMQEGVIEPQTAGAPRIRVKPLGLMNINEAYAASLGITLDELSDQVRSNDGENNFLDKTSNTYTVDGVPGYSRVSTVLDPNKNIEETEDLRGSQSAGIAIDTLVRDFFSPSGVKSFEEYEGLLSIEAYNSLVLGLNDFVNVQLKKGNYTIKSNNIIVHDARLKIAGEVDLLLELNGEFYIIDIKSSRSFANYGTPNDKFDKKRNHARQLNAYRILLKNTYGIVVKGLYVLPIEITRNKDEAKVTATSIRPLEKLPIFKLDEIPEAAHPLAASMQENSIHSKKNFLMGAEKLHVTSFEAIGNVTENNTFVPTSNPTGTSNTIKATKGKFSIEVSLDDDTEVPDALPGPIDEDELAKVIDESLKSLIIKGLPERVQYDIVMQLAYEIHKELLNSSKVSSKKIEWSAKDVFDAYKSLIEDVLQQFEQNNKTITTKHKHFQIINNEWDQVKKLTINQLKRMSGITVTRSQDDDVDKGDGENSNVRNNQNEDWIFSVTEKHNLSGKVRRMLSFVPEYKRIKDTATGQPAYRRVKNDLFSNQFKVKSFDVVYNTLQASIANARLKPNFDDIMNYLEAEQIAVPWFKDIVETLRQSPKEIQDQFVVAMHRRDTNMLYVHWRMVDGMYEAKVARADSSALQSAIRAEWDSNLLHSDLVTKNSKGELIVVKDSEVIDKFISTYNSWVDNFARNSEFPTNEEFAAWLSKVGIVLSPQTIKEIRENGIPRYGGRVIHFANLFQKFKASERNDPSRILLDIVEAVQDRGNTTLAGNPLFAKNQSILDLARVEARFNEKVWASSFRISGKSINSYMVDQFSFSRADELRDPGAIKRLRSIPYNATSKVLADLESNEAFRNLFDISTLSLDPLIQENRRRLNNTKLSKHGPINHEIIKLSMFANPTQVSGERMVKLFYPTQSDKERAIIYNFLALAPKVDAEGNLLESFVNDELLQYLVEPEVLRMNLHKDVDLEEYNKGVQAFYIIPELNMVEELWEASGKLKANVLTDVDLRAKIAKVVLEHINDLKSKKVATWETSGITSQFNGKSFIPNNYFASSKVDPNSTYRNEYLAYDFIINSMIGNVSMQQAFQGDIAQYYKPANKSYASFESQRKALFEKFASLPQEDMDFLESEKRKVFAKSMLYKSIKKTTDNLGKRLAADIAPGLLPSIDNANRKYYSWFLKDPQVASKAEEYIFKLTGNAAFKKMDGADAQELTTFKEHLDVMKMFGRLSNYEYSYLLEAERREALTQKDIDFILGLDNNITAMKPVYVGNHLEIENGVDRRVYVKSSSYPLIRQLTKAYEIDKLREAMETNNIQRAAFSSAVKVGNFSSPDDIWVWNENGTTDGTIKDNLVPTSVMEMDRGNFRLQQDIPFDLAYDEINRTTQGSKNLFTNLLNNPELDGSLFAYNNQELSINQLLDEYNSNYENLFRVEREKIEKELMKNGKLDKKRLSKMLIREAEQRGYPLNDILGLQYDKATGNFKLPLWASSSSKKFEGLLNSIVKNRVLRATLPGYSYILASEVGYKVKPTILEGKEGMKKLASISGIVYTKHFDPKKGLLPGGLIDGVTTPAQVFLPNKFVGADGKLIDLAALVDPNTGILDSTKVPDELLEQLGFRIPNQLHNSSAWLQIAGFLPVHAGDIIIAPADFTKQMGSDFDIDKLYAYVRKYIIDSNGSIKKWNYENAYENYLLNNGELVKYNAIVTEKLKKRALEARGDEDVLRGIMIDEYLIASAADGKIFTEEEIEEFIENDSKLFTFEEFKEKHEDVQYKMNVIEAHLAIYKSNNEFIQRQIKEELGYGPLEQMRDEYTEMFSDESIISPYSPDFQLNKYINATAGKDGVGVFSLDAVFNSLLQYGNVNFKPAPGADTFSFRLIGGDTYYTPGNTLSDAKLLDGSNYKSLQIAWFQSVAVDNEKLQALGPLNVNSNTFEAIKALNQMGFPADVIVAFINQDIIREYVSKLQSYSGITSDYSLKSPEQRAFDEVFSKYQEKLGREYDPTVDNNYLFSTVKNADDLKELIKKKQEVANYYSIQIALLNKFVKATSFGEILRKAQTALNVDSAAFGTTFFESTAREEDLIEVLSGEGLTGLEGIVGDIITNTSSSPKDGSYKKIGPLFIKPKGIVGSAIVHGLVFNNTLWRQLLPYDSYGVKSIFNTIEESVKKSSLNSDRARAKLRETTWSHLRSYIFSNPALGLTAEDTMIERSRLFFDKTNENNYVVNKSLATIIRELQESGHAAVADNAFINTLLLDRPGEGVPSMVRFNAASVEGFDETRYYTSFIKLIEQDEPLGNFNGINYTTRLLAQDLILASYLSGGIQEAVQFMKYIPLAYLDLIPLASKLRNLNFNIEFDSQPKVNNVVRQIIQHNPDFVTRVNSNAYEKITEKELELFKNEFVPDEIAEEVLANNNELVGMQLRDDRFEGIPYLFDDETSSLFMRVESNFYLKIPTLGARFYREYQYGQEMAVSLVKSNNRGITLNPSMRYTLDKVDDIGRRVFGQGNGESSAEKLLSNYGLSKESLGIYNDDVPNIMESLSSIKIESSNEGNRLLAEMYSNIPQVFEGTVINVRRFVDSSYDYQTRVLTINSEQVSSQASLEKLLLHEYTHAAMTSWGVREYEKYKTGKTHFLNDKQIELFESLERYQQRLIEKIEENPTWSNEFEYFKKAMNERRMQSRITMPISADQLSRNYGAYNLAEFIAMAMTDRGFQSILNSIEYTQDVSFWERFKNWVSQFLQSLGFETEGTLLSATVNTVTELVNTEGYYSYNNLGRLASIPVLKRIRTIQRVEAISSAAAPKETFMSSEEQALFALQGAFNLTTPKDTGLDLFKEFNSRSTYQADGDITLVKPLITEKKVTVQQASNAILSPYYVTTDFSKMIEYENNLYPSVVHFMSAMYLPEKVRNQFTATPESGKMLSSTEAKIRLAELSEYYSMPEKWLENEPKFLVMAYTKLAERNSMFKESLYATSGSIVYQYVSSKFTDTKYGTSTDGDKYVGKNMYGKALEQVRNTLKTSTKAPAQVVNQSVNLDETSSSTKTDNVINIYAGTGENADLSNFAERPLTDPLGVSFRNVEAAFQYAKLAYSESSTVNDDIAMKLQSATGAEAKKLGRMIKGLNKVAWDANSSAIMKSLIKDSFIENPSALARLLATGNATLTHTQDKGKWGTEFPKLLMEVREELRNNNNQQTSLDLMPETITLDGINEMIKRCE